MNTAEIALIAVVAVWSLVLVAATVSLFRSRRAAEESHRRELDNLNNRLQDAAKSVGQLEQLKVDRASLEGQVSSAQKEINRLTDELSAARTERENAFQRAQAETAACDERIERERATAATLVTREKEACEAVVRAKDKELEAKDLQVQRLTEFIEKAREDLGAQFKALSHQTLQDVSAQFEKAAKQAIQQNSEATTQNVKLHKEQIDKMLQPVGLTLGELNRFVRDSNEKRGEAEAVLMDKIREFAGANEKLANALSKPVIRGSFAEVKLELLLEAAGLVRGENFELQVQTKDGDQTRIVDALVNMAQGKKLVIDSKNLLVPYVEYANASEEERPERLAAFQRAFRTTLKALSAKDYSKQWEGVDAVIMFLPDEGMYMAAIESDRQLVAMMYEQRVFTVSPVSLLPILKSVAYILGLEKQNRDTQIIVDAGRALYESLGTLLTRVKTLGSRLEGGIGAYNELVATVEGNVLLRTRKLRELGVQRGAEHVDVAILDAQPREFRDRVVKELSEACGSAPESEDHPSRAGALAL